MRLQTTTLNMTSSPATTLGTENLGKLIWQYSIPSIIGTVVMSLYNIVDRIFIGQGVGPLAISGLALTFPFMILLMAFGMLIGAGAAARVSITMGQNDVQKAEKILGNSLTLTILISGVVSLITLIFMHDMLRAFGGTEETIIYAEKYMRIIIPFSIVSAINFGFNNIMRATGFPKKAMYTMIIGAISNVILDALFIYVFKWGIEGAAIATVISYSIGSIWVLRHFTMSKSHIRFHWINFKLDKEIIQSIISIGFSPFSMQIVTSLVMVIMNSTLLKYGGDLAIGAFGIINSLVIMVVMIVLGLNQGTQPIIGFNYGAGNYERMFKTLKISIIASTALTTLGFITALLIPELAVSFFTSDQVLIDISANALRIGTLMFPLVGIQLVTSNFFQSIGKARLSIFLSLARQFIFLIPFLLILPKFFQLNGAWLAMSASDGLSAIVVIITLYHFTKKFKREKMITQL